MTPAGTCIKTCKKPIAGLLCFRYNVHYVETFVFVERTVTVLDKKAVETKPNGHERYYLVREDILPEALVKTVHAKELLARGEVKTIHEAVEQVELSRSAFYKYKEGIFPLSKLDRERIVTISMDLEHRSGILSRVLAMIAEHEGNVLTIHQTIPLQGVANVVISVETSLMSESVSFLLDRLREQDGVSRAALVGQG
jgi:chorismate mutase